ncbi:uncharacterized protein V1518DRAFT_417344 [Limtongia smithiae]|uniref:uncharacterized protein n=1 Tax=Limtongia smithiae TaxID=1125753 RepID=UPI0034CD29BC
MSAPASTGEQQRPPHQTLSPTLNNQQQQLSSSSTLTAHATQYPVHPPILVDQQALRNAAGSSTHLVPAAPATATGISAPATAAVVQTASTLQNEAGNVANRTIASTVAAPSNLSTQPPASATALAVADAPATVSATTTTAAPQVRAKRGPYNTKKNKAVAPKRKIKRSKRSEDESNEEFTFDGLETKSGRRVHKPQQYDPLGDVEGKKRGLHFRRDLQICRVCQRGHSPESNLIVFCDGCNDPYHQLCHNPPIGRAFIEIPEAQWFCSNCQGRRTLDKTTELRGTGIGLSEADKRTYLMSLPVQHLVELMLLCEKQFPGLPIYPQNLKSDTKKSASHARVSGAQAKTVLRSVLDVRILYHSSSIQYYINLSGYNTTSWIGHTNTARDVPD